MTPPASPRGTGPTVRPRRSFSFTRLASYAGSAVVVLGGLAMVAAFVLQSLPVWEHAGSGFVLGGEWFFRLDRYGALPMVYGTLVVAGIALVLAAPVGIGAAVFTAEYLPPRLRIVVKLTIEWLAGIPSVVYGLLGVVVLRTYVYDGLTALGFDPLSGDTLLTAGLLLAIMILPTVMTLADDALRAVPASHRQAARGLGLSRAECALFVSLPQAWRGLLAAVLLALGRALGETIAVFLVVGRRDNQLPSPFYSLSNLFESGQTLTSKLGGAETNIAYGTPLHWAAIVGLGLLLFALAAGVTWISALFAGRGERHA